MSYRLSTIAIALGVVASSQAALVADGQFTTLGTAGSLWNASGGPWYSDGPLYDNLGNVIAPTSASTSASFYDQAVLTQTLPGVSVGHSYHFDLDINSQDTAADLLQTQNLAPGGLANGLSISLGGGGSSTLTQNNTLGYSHLSGNLVATSNTISITGWDLNYMQISNAQLTPVPEPATVAVFALGGLGLLIRRRPRKTL